MVQERRQLVLICTYLISCMVLFSPSYLYLRPHYTLLQEKLDGYELPSAAIKRSQDNGKTVQLAMTACRGPGVMDMLLAALKSYLSLNEMPVRIHLFLDEELRFSFTPYLEQLQLLADFEYTLYDAVYPTAALQLSMQRMYRNCATLRLFLPELLPDVDSVLYVDVDTVFMAPADQLWKQLALMNSSQMIAMADSQLNRAYRQIRLPNYAYLQKHPKLAKSSYAFDWRPVLAAARTSNSSPVAFTFDRFVDGLNTGVMLLNLTRMRSANWSARVEFVASRFQEYMRLPVQTVFNVLILMQPEWLRVFDCRYNFYSVYTKTKLSACPGAVKGGPAIIHGTESTFGIGKPFYGFSQSWGQFDMEKGNISFILRDMKRHLLSLSKTVIRRMKISTDFFISSLVRYQHRCGRRRTKYCS